MRRVSRTVFAGVVSLLLAGGVAWAQATAQLSGTVRDESGAILPGVTVTATQTDTAFFSRTVVTDDSGTYVMPNLPTGPYRLEVSLALELRVEIFNLLNNFNWGDPATNLDAGTFGRITTQAGDPRIMQFGVKYGF